MMTWSGSAFSIVILCNAMDHYNCCMFEAETIVPKLSHDSHHINDIVQRRDPHAVTLNMITIVTMVEVVVSSDDALTY